MRRAANNAYEDRPIAARPKRMLRITDTCLLRGFMCHITLSLSIVSKSIYSTTPTAT